MIKITITCDKCSEETVVFSVSKEHEVFVGVKANGFRWVDIDGKQAFLGPVCFESYRGKVTEAENAKKQVLDTWAADIKTSEQGKGAGNS